jgi:uncharacterized membrane protein
MIVFHAVKDMELFGVIAAGTTVTGGWAVFARCIAAGFLFLSGSSLVLAHARGFRAQAWARRVAMIARVSDLLCMSDPVHASPKGSMNDYLERITGRTSARH